MEPLILLFSTSGDVSTARCLFTVTVKGQRQLCAFLLKLLPRVLPVSVKLQVMLVIKYKDLIR